MIQFQELSTNDNHEEHKTIQIQDDRKKIPYKIGDHVDCKDTVNHWLNAEILEVCLSFVIYSLNIIIIIFQRLEMI